MLFQKGFLDSSGGLFTAGGLVTISGTGGAAGAGGGLVAWAGMIVLLEGVVSSGVTYAGPSSSLLSSSLSASS